MFYYTWWSIYICEAAYTICVYVQSMCILCVIWINLVLHFYLQCSQHNRILVLIQISLSELIHFPVTSVEVLLLTSVGTRSGSELAEDSRTGKKY